MEAIYSANRLENYAKYLPKKAEGRRTRAFEIGGGIGRITKHILRKLFDDFDILDQSPVQLEKAKTEVPFVEK